MLVNACIHIYLIFKEAVSITVVPSGGDLIFGSQGAIQE